MSVAEQSTIESRPSTATNTGNTGTGPSEAASKLTEALDDFLGDIEKKFKNISDEILTKLDDMAERCDRLEQEMMVRDAASLESRSKDDDDDASGNVG